MNDDLIITQTNHPYKELLNVASRTSLEVTNLDFNILYFSTLYSIDNTEWQRLNEKDLNIFDQDEIFLNPNLKITQEYKIEIFQKKENTLEDKIKLIANKNLTKIIANIDAKNLEYHEKLPMQMLQTIYKKLLKNNLFIGIRIFDFKKQLLLINKQIQNNKQQEFQLIVCKGVNAIFPQNETLELTYKEKLKNSPLTQNTPIIAINEGEIALRHLKAKQGRRGRDLHLNFIEIKEEEKKKKIHFSCSDKFELREKEFADEYIAKQKGYIIQNGDKFDIANVAEFNTVDLKNVGCINVGIDSKITINIKNLSELDDAVKSGVSIKCEELNIDGSVAQNTILNAKKLALRGTTHTQTKIFAKDAKINTHRGYFEGENVEIDLLENGHIKAKTVKINKSLGGTIEAENIFITTLMSNNTIAFNKSVIFEICEGNNNKFLAQISKNEVDFEEQLNQLTKQIHELNLELEPLKTSMQNSKEGINLLLNEIDNFKQNKQQIPASYLEKVKEYQNHLEFYENLNQKEKDLTLEKREILDKIELAQEELFKAKIINKKGVWTDMNEIKFKFIYPKQELLHSTLLDEHTKVFTLRTTVENNEEVAKIDRLDEYNEKDLEWLLQSKE
ncbi:DUF342 domain-containing protein [Campylobacter jejuni]|nr:DUF342 domain-containing protein [Campylobacter jejuni]